MTDIAELIRKRKWDTLIILLFIVALAITLPLANAQTVTKAIQSELQPIKEDISILKEAMEQEIIGNGIAAYNKFKIYATAQETWDKMETSTQNTEAMRRALNNPKARAYLITLDARKVAIFEEYFRRR